MKGYKTKRLKFMISKKIYLKIQGIKVEGIEGEKRDYGLIMVGKFNTLLSIINRKVGRR